MKERFLKLSTGALVNLYSINMARPNFDADQKLTKVTVTIGVHDHDFAGPDAEALYAALSGIEI